MSTTKQRILATSLRLLNERGASQVKQRTIAAALDMSPGNLTYHFKKSSDIIEALYFELVAKTDVAMSETPVTDNLLVGAHQLVARITASFYEYRFIFIDFMLVMRDFPRIKAHYSELLQLRRQQFLALFATLVAEGYLRPPELVDEYEHFYLRQAILGDFWFSHQQFHHEQLGPELVDEYLRVSSEAIYPYLTERGKATFREIFA